MKIHSQRAGAAAIAAVLTLLASAFAAVPARATGTITIVQSDGESNSYPEAVIKIIHSALYVTSADGKGTLVINKAACSYQGDLMVCFLTNATLVQAGKTSPLDFARGTVYLNLTDDPQPMAMTTKKVDPHSMLLSFTTKRGTYVSASGRIDKVVK
ncbi:MAG TPA: hypothetical protein VMU38_03470 [Candidatus Binatia bacterium]|nr:hypothetical protein [Candidatus Binatia bacterium]